MLHVHGRQYLCNQIEQWHINDHGEHAQDSTGTVPLPLKSPPSNHWHYCSVLPRESFHCRSAHRPNDRSEQSDPGRYASISLSRTSGCSASVTCSLLHASPTTVPAVLCDSNTGASAVPAYKGQASSNKPP